jgi:hypothetical protein
LGFFFLKKKGKRKKRLRPKCYSSIDSKTLGEAI